MYPMHEGSRSLLNLDVWVEIIRQFRFNFLDGDSTRKSKQATLRTLSLVSRQLAPLSQSEIWRTVSSVKHIARYIINAEGSNVVYDMPAKVLRKPLDAKCRARVLKILSYTRNFFCQSSTDDLDLDWEFVLLAIGHSPLFVNLDTIIVDSSAFSRPSVRNMFSVIASSSIERVLYRHLTAEDEKFVLLLHSNLRMHNAPVTSVEVLEGYRIAPFIAPRLLYTAAPGISLNINSLHLHPFDRNSFALWCMALSNCLNLISLRIVLKTLGGGGGGGTTTSVDQAGNDEIRFKKLQRLEIHASGRHDLLSDLDCPSLVDLSLHLASIAGWSTILTSMAHFTRMENLSITINERNPDLGLEDLRPVIDSLTSLRDLKILGVTSQLTEGDVVECLTTRTSLRSLIISGLNSTPLPLSIFSSIAEPQCSHLEVICLPVNLSGIASLRTPPVWPVIITLKRFIIWDGNRVPDPMRDKLKLAEFIYRTFPHAKIESLTDDRETKGWKFVKDLEELRYYISRISSDKRALRSSSSETS